MKEQNELGQTLFVSTNERLITLGKDQNNAQTTLIEVGKENKKMLNEKKLLEETC